MNYLPREILKKANEEAIYIVYVYLFHKAMPKVGETLSSAATNLDLALKNSSPDEWSSSDIQRLNILKNAVTNSPILSNSKITCFTYSKRGLTACCFTKKNGEISVVFKGTGSGEWLDNGTGLSGIPEENTYISYEKNTKTVHHTTLQNDYATDQQAEALNWFRSIYAENLWDNKNKITVSGHSKGGNKAQFVAINSISVNDCYSFDGQGFSPEALSAMKKKYGDAYEKRRNKIKSFSADNDYVNVLGERLVPQNNIYFFTSQGGLHQIEAILDNSGNLRPQCNQGNFSRYAEKVSKELMKIAPSARQYTTLGIMNIFQKYLGDGNSLNGATVSIEETIAGIGIAIGTLLRNL